MPANLDNRRMRCLFAATCAVLLGLCGGCELFDPPFAEIGMHVTENGKDCVCSIQVWNDLGRQTQEVFTNQLGVVYVKRLREGTWTFKFIGNDLRPYPAVRTVVLKAGASSNLNVEVTQEKDPEGEKLASESVVTYGTDDLSP